MKNRNSEIEKRTKRDMTILGTTLSWVAISVGTVFLTFSFLLPREGLAFAMALGLGIALMPAGLIAIVTSYASSSVIERSLHSKIDDLTASLAVSVAKLNSTTEYLDRSHNLGLRMVYPDRKQALHDFLTYAEIYVQNRAIPKRELIFVGSSLKGVITETPAFAIQLEKIIEKTREHPDECTCYILLTHPFYSRYRETQEDRPSTGIAKEILHAIAWLEARRETASNIRIKVYKGTPTCFMISTSERMLINPYPYQVEAFKCFCLEVEVNERPDNILTAFYTNHFYKPWFGEEKREDHYLQPNALDYLHLNLEGPIPEISRRVPGSPDKYGDFFVIPDQGSFYLAVNIRGLATEIPYDRKDDGAQSILRISNRLEVRLLNLSPDAEEIWETVGEIAVDEERNGFWHNRLDSRSLSAYSMIGVFDSSLTSPFAHEELANEKLRGTPLPVLWRWLVTRELLPPAKAVDSPKNP
ncbi:MAG TPA: hypothetical protein VN937_25705 [Blastocatellia bacterium]|nr:hypothetical protein [Blastocatellia bacterium]